ncbi:response regulator transcription factor [Sinanaerobacter chloroacetimidivorans]|jgi:DNA-binding response OmpR family regulator|uniref:Stage 0 sporulation protein A homolog n=1 Tax=Sinanaerobacter chloroacetimidivorans TaxID=2818044 RepID=A0A8J8B4H3_9FIRM|nr:response regulator transcription factor [Sinanaerobacter chloroacetimidivorans]MBR0599350.1 response regulator transcription factor [Sinanaerobacter chloroacetimidivorans]
MAKEKILIIDDEVEITKLVCAYLTKEHFTPIAAHNGKQALALLKKEKPDLIILDIMLPDTEGSSLSLEIRKTSNAPIIFLSCKTQEIDKIIALSAGGDDYMTKPFMPGELVARIKAHLRRQYSLSNLAAENQNNIYEFDGLIIDFDTHELSVNGRQIALTSKEFEILKLLVENPRKVFSADRIFETVWKTNCMENDSKTIMVYISNLRKKIEENPNNPRYILNVRGVGYKFNQSLFK